MTIGCVLLLVAALLSATCNWLSIYRGWRVGEYISKPFTMALLIGCALLLPVTVANQWLAKLFTIGLVFSLIGDVFLMRPNNKLWFLSGLTAFFCGHVAYILGMNNTLPPLSSWPVLVAALVTAFFVIRVIIQGMVRNGKSSLIPPVKAYALVLALMFYSGMTTFFRPDWSLLGSIICVISATLFFISDSFLSYGLFVAVRENRVNRVIVMVTYFLAQIGLTLTIAFWQV